MQLGPTATVLRVDIFLSLLGLNLGLAGVNLVSVVFRVDIWLVYIAVINSKTKLIHEIKPILILKLYTKISIFLMHRDYTYLIKLKIKTLVCLYSNILKL